MTGAETRRRLLSHNGQEMANRILNDTTVDDPVGLIIEMTDPIGKQIAYASLESQGMANSDIAELIAATSRNAIPTHTTVLPMAFAKQVLSETSPTAESHLSVDRIPGNRFIVIIGGGGNSYVQVPGRPI